MTDGGGTPALDIVTVVYGREVELLRLQACSMARYLAPAGIGRIMVLVNDIDEAACADRVAAMLGDYGPLAGRVEIVRPDALFALRPASDRPRGLGQRFGLWFTRHRRAYPFGVKSGWRGNRGWSVQQALKLAAARRGDSAFVLLLDSKNHFVRPVGLDNFVSAQRRARSYRLPPDDKQWGWIVGSFRLLGVSPPDRQEPAPPTVTPVCVPRAELLHCLEAVEARTGPVEAFFAHARSDQSEFMLIYAAVVGRYGSWDAAFDPGLNPAATIHRRSDAATIDRVLTRVETGAADILSVHRSRLANLDPTERSRIEAIWRARGLPSGRLLAPEPET